MEEKEKDLIMFQEALNELLSLSEADIFGKNYYEQTGEFLSDKAIDEKMVQTLLKAGTCNSQCNGCY